jgi:hypothetical protein
MNTRQIVWFSFLGFALTATVPCHGLSHKDNQKHKIFPATSDSIRSENVDADRMYAVQYNNQEEVNEAELYGVLVPFVDSKWLEVSRTLPRERRYARPETVAFVEILSREFHEQFPRHRLKVDSAIRPADYQLRLRRHNKNAAAIAGDAASTHQRGTTVDLGRRMGHKEYRWLMLRLMYYRSLGAVRVIEEVHCVHIFVGGDYGIRTSRDSLSR